MSNLAVLQNQFQSFLITSYSNIHQSIVNTEKVSIDQRLSIYHEAYRFRLLDSIANNFPILLSYLNPDDFSRLGLAYIDKFPSPYRSIRWFGDSFADFLKENAEPYLAELAEFEWKMTLSFDAADDNALDLKEMASIPPDAWATVCFRPHPSLQLMHFTWNMVAVWEAISNEQQPPKPHEEKESLLWALWRRDYLNRFYSLDGDEAWALAALAKGASFGELCEGLCRWQDEQEVGMRAASLLKGWIQSGLIAAIIMDNS